MKAGPRAEGRRPSPPLRGEIQTQAVLRAVLRRAQTEQWPPAELQRVRLTLEAWRRQRAWQGRA